MTSRTSTAHPTPLFVALSFWMIAVAACRPTTLENGGETSIVDSQQTKAKANHAAKENDLYQVPTGGVVKLEAFIDRIRAYQAGDTMELLEHERKAAKVLLVAAHDIMKQETDTSTTAIKKYGILAIPVMILVGRDGKVLSVNARGKDLEQLLAKQFSKSAA